jgi:hypothetical protein
MIFYRYKDCCRTLPTFVCRHTIRSRASGISSSVFGSVQRCVRAVGIAREPCIVFTGARLPTCRWPGSSFACIYRFVVSSAGTPPVRGGFLPSGFPPRPSPWPPQYRRLHGLTPRRPRYRRSCWRTARAHPGSIGELSANPASGAWGALPSPCGPTGDWA